MYSFSLIQVQLQKLKPSANFVIYALICCKFSKLKPMKSILLNKKICWVKFSHQSGLNLDFFDFKNVL